MNISQSPADLSIDNTIQLAVGLLTQAFHHEVDHSCPRDRPFSFAAAVDAFHRAALDAGYTDNGAPGERAAYHPGYYGAFVLDPDGHNIEAVNHNRV